ncbi:hypothetical protein [Kitasatospora sp. NPDC047058]|uniref:hypothetical protein n=1 Tax=Kitasatospora sp. NPDC047058 TaxID=3155620 RepID=UPI0033DC101B
MNRRSAVLVPASVVLALVAGGCAGAGGTTPAAPAMPALDVQDLRARLLTPDDLGADYAVPVVMSADSTAEKHGCPSGKGPSGDADGSRRSFAAKADISFTSARAGGGSLQETLHSDTPAKLSAGLRAKVAAELSCPSYTITDPVTVQVTVTRLDAPPLGDEQYRQTTTVTVAGTTTTYRWAAVRVGNVAVVLQGSPDLVDGQLPAAVRRAAPATGRP